MDDSTNTPEFLQLKARFQEGGEAFIRQSFATMYPTGIQWLVETTQGLEDRLQGTNIDQGLGALCISELYEVVKITERSLTSGVSFDGGPVVAPPVNVTALRAIIEFYLDKHGPSDLAWSDLIAAIRFGHTAHQIQGTIPISVKAPGTGPGRTEPSSSKGEKQVLNPVDFTLMSARPQVKASLILLLFLAIGVAIGVRGTWTGTAARLVIAAPIAIVALFLYGQLLRSDAGDPAPRRSWGRAISAAGVMPAYLLGCYLVFLEGAGGVWTLFRSFSISSLVWSLAAIFFGYRLVYQTWLLTEIGEAVRTGRLRTDASLPRISH